MDGQNEGRKCKGYSREVLNKGRKLVSKKEVVEWGNEQEENEQGWLTGARTKEVEEGKAADGAQ